MLTNKDNNWKYHYSSDYDGSTKLHDARQERYCQEYIKDLNNYQAALRAGYKQRSARNTASRLMSYHYIKKRIGFLSQKVAKKTEITTEKILNGILEIAEGKKTHEMAKLKAWELLGKYKAMFTERREIIEKPKRIIIRNGNGKIEEELA